MSETVRTLIKSAFMRSTIRGLRETPDADETKDALDMLNEILDVLCRKEDFSAGMGDYVLNVPPKGFITFSDNPHRIFTATIDGEHVHDEFYVVDVVCGDSHNLVVGDSVTLRLQGIDYDTDVVEVKSYKEFTVYVRRMFAEGKFLGSFKLQSEPDEFLIDIITTPPVNIYQVVGSGEGVLQECKQQFFYSQGNSGTWWFYSKGNTPYPRLYVTGCSRVKVVFEKPFPRKVTLDTDLTAVDPAALSALKYRLAAEIAASAGFDDKEKSLLARYRNAYATYARSKSQTEETEPDTSMAGYGYGVYDIRTDGASNATF